MPSLFLRWLNAYVSWLRSWFASLLLSADMGARAIAAQMIGTLQFSVTTVIC
jgi:hypothetical protein